MHGFRINDRAVGALRARAKAYIAFDAKLAGFGVRVLPSGTKTYLIEYRPHPFGRSAPKRRYKIGGVGEWSAVKARTSARALLSRVRAEPADGRSWFDPAADRTAARGQRTVAEVIDEFIEHLIDKGKSADWYKYLLNRLIRPKFGNRKIDAVTRGDFDRLHRSLKSTPYMANRMLAVVASMYSFAANQRHVQEGFHPTHKIQWFKESGRERYLTGEELDRLGIALREAETIGLPWTVNESKPKAKHAPKPSKRRTKLSPQAVAAIRLLIFTGCRLREILNLRWADVDFDRGLLFLPDSKTGRKTVVLNGPALAVLASLPRIGVYVIASDSAGTKDESPRRDLKRPWDAVRKHAGLDGGDGVKAVRIHDLRHTHASIAAGGGLGLPIIGKLLGHRRSATTAKYAHLDADPVRRASEFIGGRLAAAMGEVPKHAKAAEIIRLR